MRQNLVRRLHEHIDLLPNRVKDRVREYIVSTQGKMLRPLLVVATAKLLGATPEQMETAYISGVSVELLHNFTLMHDDILDKAPLRRGKESYHIKYGSELAIHDGDIVHSFALAFIKDDRSLRLMLEISNLVGLGNGIELEDRLDNVFDFTKEHVIEVLRLKTAIVFFGCVQLAGFAVNKIDFTEELRDIITDGGIAFQIQDDILDILGETAKFGKQSYWDIQESKRNLFLYYSLKTEHNEKIKAIYSKPVGEKTEEDILFILEIFKTVKSNILEDRDRFLESCLDRLDKKIDEMNGKDSSEQLIKLYEFLRELIIYLCTREK
jgi:geranylgeranyl diphosphate synthase type II